MSAADISETSRRVAVRGKLGFGVSPPSREVESERTWTVISSSLLQLGSGTPLDQVPLELRRRQIMRARELGVLLTGVTERSLPDWVLLWARLGYPDRQLTWSIAAQLERFASAVETENSVKYQHARAALKKMKFVQTMQLLRQLPRPVAEGSGFLYVLATDERADVLKVGFTHRDIPIRVREINSASGVVLPWGVRAAWKVRYASWVERNLHFRMRDYRIRSDREFFQLPLMDAEKTIEAFIAEHFEDLR